MRVQKTAIFGGTFSPPHIGHIAMVKGLAELSEIEKILVMPAKIPPHKDGDVISAEHRVNMCKLAFNGIKKVEFCLDELYLEGKSYTLNTLEHLKTKGVEYPIFVIGADSFINFHKWFCYEKILKLAELYVYSRNGFSFEDIIKTKEDLEKKGAKITLLDFVPPAVASRDIRKMICDDNSVNELLAPSVLEYINKHSLYR